MNRDSFVLLLKSRLTRAGDSTLDAKIISELQFVQGILEAEAFLPWFLVGVNTSMVSVAATETVAPPATFLMELSEEKSLWIRNTDLTYSPLDKFEYSPLATDEDYSGSGTPLAYSLLGNLFYLKPTPDAIFNFKLFGYFADTVITTNIENNWLKFAPDLMLAEVGKILAEKYMRDTELTATFVNDASVARSRLITVDTARREASIEQVMQYGDGFN